MARNQSPSEAAAAGVAEREAAKQSSVDEYYEREANSQPTPTQEENDLAKVGALGLDDKEPDGSEPEEVAQRRAMESRLPGSQPYANRALGASGDEQSNAVQQRAAAETRKGAGKGRGQSADKVARKTARDTEKAARKAERDR